MGATENPLMNLIDRLAALPDPRRRLTTCSYSVAEIVFLTLCGTLAGQHDLVAVESWGEESLDWLRQYLPYTQGIPSHDTLGRVLGQLDPHVLTESLQPVLGEILALKSQVSDKEPHIAIDGKTLGGSRTRSRRPEHVLHAWDVRLQHVLNWMWVGEKTNELGRAPALIKSLNLQGTTLTCDALFAQKDLFDQVVSQGGQMIVALRGNQPSWVDDVKWLFQKPPRGTQVHTFDESEAHHGRQERRVVSVMPLQGLERTGLSFGETPIQTVVEIQSHRDDSFEKRLYLSTRDARSLEKARAVKDLIRAHWSVENHLHRTLDVAFHEDDVRVRQRHLVRNLASIRRLAQHLLQLDVTAKPVSFKRKMLKWCLNSSYRSKLFDLFSPSTPTVSINRPR